MRSQSVSIYIDALVAVEAITYAKQTLHIPNFLRYASTSPFVESDILWRFIKAQLMLEPCFALAYVLLLNSV